MRSRGEAMVGVLGDEVTQKLKQFADIVCRFRLQKRSKFENSHTIHLLILTSLFYGGAKRYFAEGGLAHGGLSPCLVLSCYV